MGNSAAPFSRLLRTTPKALDWALPLSLAIGLVLVGSTEGGSQGDPAEPRASGSPAAPCGLWHRGGGETTPVDLDQVGRAYRELGARLGRSLEALPRDSSRRLELAAVSELPACRGAAERSRALPPERAEALRGRTFYFASAETPGGPVLPAELEQDPRTEILLLGLRRPSDLAELSRRLGRPVTLVDAEFAKALGVRCVGTWVRLSENGDGLVLHEGR